ncbi:YihY/virulence factor BrkB family protein [Halobacillus salinarum]|uniref:YihY/virulence factor BrkB family protein n=1 Tax=Halobacillus salinarum TaxID=2932257 RepID=A0ABY4EN27_9BACI|nr:YihY/virulence factor BrkB family protein [Halobacillus salinarum]UOQ45017.1 YihY/virulence factor BrkB family protein [Halobacillus salinarum]
MKKLKQYAKEVGAEFQKDNIPILGAAQAYHYLLAIVPLLILLLSILPYLNIDPETAMDFMKKLLPGDTAEVFRENILSIINKPKGGLLTIGIVGTVWSASNGMNAFIQAVNVTYNVDETRSFIRVRLLSIALTLGMIISIVVALVLPIFGGVLTNFLDSALSLHGNTVVLFQVLRWVISIVVMALILMALYHFAPNKTHPFSHIVPGALITAALWQIISLAFSFYIANFANYSATYGSLGGLIILMLWFFLTGIILMVGAEINVVYHRRKTEREREVA